MSFTNDKKSLGRGEEELVAANGVVLPELSVQQEVAPSLPQELLPAIAIDVKRLLQTFQVVLDAHHLGLCI